MTTPEHTQFMTRALFLAERGRGGVEPNPVVGAVIVKDRRIIGESYHKKFGEAHAEANAIAACAESCEGATLYVTLEPCCHHGKTPPCVDEIIRRKFGTVVIATRDPNPLVNGKSVQALLQAGINVVESVLAAEAQQINHAFFKRMRTGKPYVIAKWAMSLDGKIATKSGDSKWISSEEALDFAHHLRAGVGAVIVGLGTVLKDDPQLTVRRIPNGRNPLRVILDSRAKLPNGFIVVKTAKQTPTLIVVTDEADSRNVARLQQAGCGVLQARSHMGLVDLDDMLKQLGARGIDKVLIEGGSQLLGSAFDSREVDEVVIIIAPKIIGGATAVSPIGGSGRHRVEDALQLEHIETRQLGRDFALRGRVAYPE